MNPFVSRPQTFSEAYKAARIIETLENYVVADRIDPIASGGNASDTLTAFDEMGFWTNIMANGGTTFDQRVTLQNFTLSDWVPRVPGLYYNDNAEQLRYMTRDLRSIYGPMEKSQFVMGGLGTNLLAPENGQRIVSVCQYDGVAAGIPILISDTVWNRLSLQPGHVVTLTNVRWQRMAREWAQRFESIAGIPRAYLSVTDESQITVSTLTEPPVYQPYTVLEYVKDNTLLYDYVFCSFRYYDNRRQVSDFFEMYRTEYGYNGRYLLNPDPANPLFDSAYDSPDQLRRAENGGQYHLEILKERIRNTYYSGKRITDILRVLSMAYADATNVNRVATYLQFPVVTFIGNRAADRIAQLVDWCVDTPGKMEELIDKLVVEQPDLLRA